MENEINLEIPEDPCDGLSMTRLNPLVVCLCGNNAISMALCNIHVCTGVQGRC